MSTTYYSDTDSASINPENAEENTIRPLSAKLDMISKEIANVRPSRSTRRMNTKKTTKPQHILKKKGKHNKNTPTLNKTVDQNKTMTHQKESMVELSSTPIHEF